MKRFLHLSGWVIALTVGSIAIAWQDDAPQQGPALKITATAVEGFVQYRHTEEDKWQKLTAGTALQPGTQIRTGPRSACRMTIEPGQILSIDRLGFFKLIVANRVGNIVKTDIGMQYGRARYRVRAAGEEHDARVISPSATLAIRGTDSTVESDAIGVGFYSNGTASITNSITGRKGIIGSTQPQKANAKDLNGTKFAKAKTSEANPRGDFTSDSDDEKARFDKHPGDAGNLLGSEFETDRENATNEQNKKEHVQDGCSECSM